VSWFRSNRGKVTWLALFALSCQLFLSFGHIHLGRISIAPIAVTAGFAIAVNSGDDSAALPRAPPQNNPRFADDFCAICASISLANSLVVPTAPAVVPPISSDRARLWSYAGFKPSSFEHRFFEARGPPYA
jgi:hypothetical protein